jgi:hypothetical protein
VLSTVERYLLLANSASGFHEPAFARQRVYARLRVLECLLFRLDLEPPCIRTRTSTFIFKALNLVSGLKKYAKRASRLGRKSRSSLSKALSKRSKTVLRHYKGTSMDRRAIRVIVYCRLLDSMMVFPGLYSTFQTSKLRCVHLAR